MHLLNRDVADQSKRSTGTDHGGLETEAGPATLTYSFQYPIPDSGGMSEGSLELGGKLASLSGLAPAAVPEGAQFLFR